MKAIILIALIAAAFCYPEASIKKEETAIETIDTNDVFEILRCLIKQTVQLTPDISELIDAIKIQDYVRVFTIAVKIYQDGKAIYPQCFASLTEALKLDGQYFKY